MVTDTARLLKSSKAELNSVVYYSNETYTLAVQIKTAVRKDRGFFISCLRVYLRSLLVVHSLGDGVRIDNLNSAY